jgi:hypothetical protein
LTIAKEKQSREKHTQRSQLNPKPRDEPTCDSHRITCLEAAATTFDVHQPRKYLGHKGRAHCDGRSRDTTERGRLSEYVLYDKRSNGYCRSQCSGTSDLTGDKDAQRSTLNELYFT